MRPTASRRRGERSVQARADHVAMVERAMAFAEAGRGANRFQHVIFGSLDGRAQGKAVGDTAGDRGGEGAAGAVRGASDDARVLEVRAFTVGTDDRTEPPWELRVPW